MGDVWADFKSALTLGAILGSAVFAGIQWLVMWGFGSAPKRKWTFLFGLFVLNFAALSVAISLARPPREAPDFTGSTINNVTAGDVSEGDTPREGQSGVMLLLSLRNTGIASAIDRPSVEIVTSAGASVRGSFLNSITLILKSGRKANATSARINPSPIVARGSIVPLQVLCRFEGIMSGDVFDAGTKLVLRFYDSFGRQYTLEHAFDGTNAGML